MVKKVLAVALILVIACLVYYFGFYQKKSKKEESGSLVYQQGLKIEILKEGNKQRADEGDTIVVHYTGWLEDGTKFDSSVDRGKPFSFTLGAGQVIKGWDRGILGMRIGEKRKLTVAPTLAYGKAGIPGIIPPNAVLIFEVELLGIR